MAIYYNNKFPQEKFGRIRKGYVPPIKVIKNGHVVWEVKEPDDRYLTLTSAEDTNVVTWTGGMTSYLEYEYSFDGAQWSGSLMGLNETLNSGDKIFFRRVPSYTGGHFPFSEGVETTKTFKLSGNVECLVIRKNYGSGDLPDYAFSRMFKGMRVVDASQLLLPPDASSNCFAEMFSQCGYLKSSPDIHNIIISDYCYYYMFANCYALEDAPNIIGDDLKNGCCAHMFYQCTSLVNPPSIEGTKFWSRCCESMFEGCSKLITTPVFHFTIAEAWCCLNMFYNCASLQSSSPLLAKEIAQGAYESMFYGCGGLLEVPDIQYDSISTDCCNSMFKNCIKITHPTKLITVTEYATGCYDSMFENCLMLNLYTTPQPGGNSWLCGTYHINMFKNTKAQGVSSSGEPTVNTTYYW